MFTREIIELRDCPLIMQEAVNNYLSICPESAVLSAQKTQETPFMDKAIIMSTFKVFTLCRSYFTVYKMSTCSNPDYWSINEVTENSMAVGDISEIVSLSPEWFSE